MEGRWIASEAPVDRPAALKRMRERLTRDETVSLLADDDGLLVGSLGLEVTSYGVADLGMLVAPERRGQGIGSALLDAGIEWARSHDAHKIALEVWPHNEPAIGLYRKFGFEEEGRLRHHYRRRTGELWDAIIMGLSLS
jgi:ribosomal protein S18 acetylase RimI-like enzyme